MRARTSTSATAITLTSSVGPGRYVAINIMTCPHCQGDMWVIAVAAVATEADDIRAVLGTAPPPPPPPLMRQLELDFAAA